MTDRHEWRIQTRKTRARHDWLAQRFCPSLKRRMQNWPNIVWRHQWRAALYASRGDVGHTDYVVKSLGFWWQKLLMGRSCFVCSKKNLTVVEDLLEVAIHLWDTQLDPYKQFCEYQEFGQFWQTCLWRRSTNGLVVHPLAIGYWCMKPLGMSLGESFLMVLFILLSSLEILAMTLWGALSLSDDTV